MEFEKGTQGNKGAIGTKETETSENLHCYGELQSTKLPETLLSFEALPPPRVNEDSPGFIPAHGGYRNLRSFQKSQIVYDATVYFCARFLSKRDRTYDQMIQAARSGKQNIVEGSQTSGTSKEFEIKLTNVARASLEELLIDYQDFLRTRGLAEWTKEHPYVQRFRELNRQPDTGYDTFRKGIEHADPAICANIIICLIKVTNYLLDRQIKRLEQDFIREGGLRERMSRVRRTELERRRKRGNRP